MVHGTGNREGGTVFRRRRISAAAAQEATAAKARGRLEEIAVEARANVPRAYPDGRPFESDAHIANMIDLGVKAAYENDEVVFFACLQVIVGFSLAATHGPSMPYTENVFGARRILLARGADAEERTLAAAALALADYWDATGQMDEFIRSTRPAPE
jgi:hypothetical protein